MADFVVKVGKKCFFTIRVWTNKNFIYKKIPYLEISGKGFLSFSLLRFNFYTAEIADF